MNVNIQRIRSAMPDCESASPYTASAIRPATPSRQDGSIHTQSPLMKHRHTTKRAVAIASAALFSATLMPVAAIAGQGVTVYFTRHAEKMTELMQTAPGKFMEICTQDREDCAEVLNPVGELRAKLLADYFDRRHITVRLTNVFSSDKQRTRQTVAEIAERTGLSNDTDQMSGDGVQQLPADVNDEFSSNSISVQPTVDALLSLPPGSVCRCGGPQRDHLSHLRWSGYRWQWRSWYRHHAEFARLSQGQ